MKKAFNFDFVGKRKIFFTITASVMAVMLLAVIFVGPNLDISFKGGTILSYSYTGDVDADVILETAEEVLGQDLSVNVKTSLLGDKDSIELTLEEDTGVDSAVQTELTDLLMETYPDNDLELSVTSVNPTIGTEFLIKCLVSVAFAALIIICYVALRFKKISGWSAGAMAIGALLHDTFFVFGTFVLFGLAIDDSFIAVILTILGYSVNDTIVVYDRIRENRNLYGDKKTPAQLVNMSINQTLSRSINTTITTVTTMLVVTIVAMLMGVSSIVSFSLPMCIGLLVGTYSTICLAGPWWVMWQEYKEKKAKHRRS